MICHLPSSQLSPGPIYYSCGLPLCGRKHAHTQMLNTVTCAYMHCASSKQTHTHTHTHTLSFPISHSRDSLDYFMWGCMKYSSIVSVLSAVAGRRAPSLVKQRGAPDLLWTDSAKKMYLNHLTKSPHKNISISVSVCYIKNVFIALPWCQTFTMGSRHYISQISFS